MNLSSTISRSAHVLKCNIKHLPLKIIDEKDLFIRFQIVSISVIAFGEMTEFSFLKDGFCKVSESEYLKYLNNFQSFCSVHNV